MTRLNHVFMRLLDTCNLECAHCYSSCGPKAPDKLPLEAVLKVARRLGEIQVRSVHLEGGEALIYKGFWQVLDTLNEVGIKPSVTSNGLIVTESVVERLAGRVSRLTFSVDGHTADVHDQIRRRKGSFDKVVRAIRLSKAADIPTHMISVIWKRNVGHPDEMIAMAEDLKVDRQMLFSCGNIGAAVKNWEELTVGVDEWTRYLYRVRALAETRPWVWFEIDRLKKADLTNFITRDYQPVCTRQPRDSVTIDPLGDVYPCGYFIPVKKSLGNIMHDDIVSIAGRAQDGERYSGACRDAFKQPGDGVVELCKIYSVNRDLLPS
ncbi:radical SAM/SPASM domain-containing protein [Micromonospora sediminicola]|uniref:radical SAM/SPASM domain-containing protein n=1 Tax=Micromonospora sediminicola TaxID=946078 RepID=UPI00378E7054